MNAALLALSLPLITTGIYIWLEHRHLVGEFVTREAPRQPSLRSDMLRRLVGMTSFFVLVAGPLWAALAVGIISGAYLSYGLGRRYLHRSVTPSMVVRVVVVCLTVLQAVGFVFGFIAFVLARPVLP